MKKASRYLRYMAAPLIIGSVIFVGTCLLGSGDMPNLPNILAWDKVGHFGMFFLLSGVSFLNYYLLHNGKPQTWKWIFWGIVIPAIYGGAIELMQQYLFPHRSAEWGDYIADILGTLAATALAFVWLKRRSKR